ncbi:DNA-binding response regulator [Geomonas sp. RF6]|uniref:response regulator transcription factor n=1 Tax=Geomonas sp. RF6 TaxID=2897342 RepID=UPI001E51AA38|nr:DNA-binding response regulator [Geomonas sp. RF6]UFS72079.1 DNA-binding response regulator [Geomonas sp. RF6]
MTTSNRSSVIVFQNHTEDMEFLASSGVVAVVLDAEMLGPSRLNLLANLRSSYPEVTIIVADRPDLRAAPESLVPERLIRAAQYIQDHCSEPLYLERIASEACLSKFHFSREFKRYFSVSPIQFMINSRINLALDLMAQGMSPLAHVAVHCGFSDQSEFTKWFQRITGSPPSSWNPKG